MEVREPAIDYKRRKYSIEEYLEIEKSASEKHEYFQGEIFAMSGAKLEHNIVSRNLSVALSNKLKGKPCKPFGSDLRIHIEKNSLFTYPDISVFCEDVQTFNNDEANVLNPTLIIEVLSPSTRSYDLGEKFSLYRSVPTLKEYVAVDPLKVYIEVHFINNNNNWELREYKDISDDIYLPSLQMSLRISEIYEGIEL